MHFDFIKTLMTDNFFLILSNVIKIIFVLQGLNVQIVNDQFVFSGYLPTEEFE